MLTPRLMQAINTAAIVHEGHARKGTNLPYMTHLFAVMTLATEVTDDEDILIACLLHDTIEDVPEKYNAEDIENDFGPRVRRIVEDVTKTDLPTWQERSDAYIAHLRKAASTEAVMVSLADKMHNLMSILDDYNHLGDELWSRFNSDKERQQWWYRSILHVAQDRIPACSLLQKYGALVEELDSL